MAELVSRYLEQICTAIAVDRPEFGIIEVRIASVDWEIGMSQSTTSAVKWIAIPVLALFKPAKMGTGNNN